MKWFRQTGHVLLSLSIASASQAADLEGWLQQSILDSGVPQKQVEDYCAARVLRMPQVNSVQAWEA
ncbi:MAG: hypothetical protein VB858_02595 [Planctomycetaceae bacterium]